ncbi:MAG: hypothetical protein R3B53_03525 [Candidatus Paceibacterota bacterium]
MIGLIAKIDLNVIRVSLRDTGNPSPRAYQAKLAEIDKLPDSMV